MAIMANGAIGDNAGNGDGDGDGDVVGDGDRRSAIGGRQSWLVSWLVVVVRRPSLVARFESR